LAGLRPGPTRHVRTPLEQNVTQEVKFGKPSLLAQYEGDDVTVLDRPITGPGTALTGMESPDTMLTVPVGDTGCPLIRPLRAADRDAVRRFYDQLSTDTLYRRFFTAGRSTAAELRRLFDVDPGGRDALVALAGAG